MASELGLAQREEMRRVAGIAERLTRDKLLRVSQVAELLGVEAIDVTRLSVERKIPRPKMYGGMRCWDKEEVFAWLAARPPIKDVAEVDDDSGDAAEQDTPHE